MADIPGIKIEISAKTKYAPGTGLRWKIGGWLIDLGCRIAATTVQLTASVNDQKYPINNILPKKKR